LANSPLEDALALHKAGRLKEAEAAYRDILETQPDAADAWHFLGLLEAATGRLETAQKSISKAVSLDGERPTFHYNLGFVFQGLERFNQALSHYRKSLELEPNQPAAHYNAGLVLSRMRRYAEAIEAVEAAITLQPAYAEAWGNLGAAKRSLGDNQGAVEACRKALELNPSQAEVHATLGNAVKEMGDYAGGISHYRKALQLNPNLVTAHFNLGNTLVELGQIEDGRDALEKAAAIDPTDFYTQNNLLMSRLYDAYETETSLLNAHLAATTSLPAEQPLSTSYTTSNQRLKVGFVSADFKQHSCAYFLDPLLRSLDRSAVEVHAYSMVGRPDETTERLRSLMDGWTDCIPLGDDELTEKIRADGIDVLVDLSGHTSGNRLPVFAKRAAPVQISWLGYPATSGLKTMDARLTDTIADPIGDADRHHSEKLVRLSPCFLVYGPAENAPAVSELPAAKNGYVTFGSFNNLSKINPAVIEAWSRILKATPNARLMLKGRTMNSPGVRDRLIGQFQANGIDAKRLDLIDWVPRDQNPLALYGKMDIALDTFPYNGTTTTCEALWMGVPVVTFTGERHAARVGASLLSAVGLTDYIAEDRDAYVDRAIAAAKDLEDLEKRRLALRQQMAASPLCDGVAFAKKFLGALKQLVQLR